MSSDKDQKNRNNKLMGFFLVFPVVFIVAFTIAYMANEGRTYVDNQGLFIGAGCCGLLAAGLATIAFIAVMEEK